MGMSLVINMSAKSGGNRFAGSASADFQSLDWNANNAPEGGSPSIHAVHQMDFSLGGPIKRDRTWFFGAFRWSEITAGTGRSELQKSSLAAFAPDRLQQITVGPITFQDDILAVGGQLYGAKFMSVWKENTTSTITVNYNNKGGNKLEDYEGINGFWPDAPNKPFGGFGKVDPNLARDLRCAAMKAAATRSGTDAGAGRRHGPSPRHVHGGAAQREEHREARRHERQQHAHLDGQANAREVQ